MGFVPYNSHNLPDYLPESGTNDSFVSPPVTEGYDIRAVRLSTKRREAALARANGTLSNSREKVNFFITNVRIDLGLTGTTGQGRRTRDFYPHNILMPSYVVTGICLDQGDYGTLVEFVHKTQQEAVGNVKAGNFIQLDVAEGGFATKRSIMRGRHKPICAQGVVEMMKRVHKQFAYAPIFTMSVVVAHEFYGLFNEISGYEPKSQSWWEVLQGLQPYQPPKKQSTAKGSAPTSFPESNIFSPPGPPLATGSTPLEQLTETPEL
jgi:hypothetical protein